MLKGADSHKKIDLNANPLLRLYYTSRVRPSRSVEEERRMLMWWATQAVLFSMCAFNEVAFAALYLLYFSEGPERV
jgi:hypothetical protein